MLSETSFRVRLLSLIVLLVGILTLPILAAPDPGQVTLGKHAFRAYCASCHGQEARGGGPVAEYLLVAPADLTQISARHEGTFPTELVFKIIDGREKVRGHGNSEMPIWGDAFQKGGASEEEAQKRITALVHFLESIQEP